MKSTSKSSKVLERYGMIEPLEARIAPAAVGTIQIPSNAVYPTIVSGGGAGSIGVTSLLLKAGEVLTTGNSGGGSYLLFVSQGQILVHVTDLNNNGQVEFNEITGISAGNGAVFTSFVDIHGDVVTDLNPDGTLSHNGAGDILLDNNIQEIDLRSLSAADFTGNANESATQMATDHLALSSYSIFGNIYAGGGLGVANNVNSGLHLDTSGTTLQALKYTGEYGTDLYLPSTPVIGSIYVGSSASGKPFSFGASGSAADVFGNLLAFTPAPGEAGASIYNISSAALGQTFNIGTIHAGDGGFNAPGGSVVNVALQGDNAGVYKLIAGNAGSGTTGQNGGSVINFSETGAFLGEVVLQSGNGGTGLTGAGGNGGNITFSSANTSVQINAHFVLEYGSGGNGYTKGGNGGGTPSGIFITPAEQVTTPLNLVSSMHTIGSIGSTTPIDFNGDGISDIVYSTTSPNQVVVSFGGYVDGAYTMNVANNIYLNAPANVDAITVGDFTGNGHPDIAVATGTGSNAGIEVYLSQYNPKTGAFEGFSDPLFSPLPSLDQYNFYTSTVTVTKIVSGGFVTDPLTGHQVTDLAVLEQAQVAGDGGTVTNNVMFFLNGETNAAHPFGSGYFYANFKSPNTPVINLTNAYNLGSATQSTFVATALKAYTPGSGGHDSIVFSDFNDYEFAILSDNLGTPQINGYTGWGDVFPPGAKNPVQFYDYSFTVTQDPTTPSIADVVAVSQRPQAFMVVLQGNGTPNGFNIVSGDGVGIDLGYGSGYEPVGIVALPGKTTVNNSVPWSSVAVLDYNNNGVVAVDSYTIAINNTTGAAVNFYNGIGDFQPATRSTVVAFGAYVPEPVTNANHVGSGPMGDGVAVANPLLSWVYGTQEIAINQPVPTVGFGAATQYFNTKDAGYFFVAGNGGNSQAGAGGTGGSFGQAQALVIAAEQTTIGSTSTGTGALAIEFPNDSSYEGSLNMVAGNGGNGFTNAGAGGSLSDISLQYATTLLTGNAFLFAGNGGQSLTATGGAGGSESQLFIESGQAFIAGNGGIGVIGGAGGSLYGNTTAGLVTSGSNNVDPIILLRSGNGATGITGGGSGGNINSWAEQFDPYTGAVYGLLNYVAGNAGNAVAGQAGTGGSIINCSPSTFNNNLGQGDIYLQSGAGGNGLYGGAGGNITQFAEISSIKDVPTSTTFLAGSGGNATFGTGGAGGSISQISASSSGEGFYYTFDLSNPYALRDVLTPSLYTTTPISYNRMVAGEGGSSAGGIGGAGGGIGGKSAYLGNPFNIDTSSVGANAANVIVAGAAGSGLTAGGAGGSVLNVSADAGTGDGKVLIVAGDGGAATGAAPSDAKSAYDIANAIGGYNGPGGAGGSITNFQQSLSTSTHVDLIAGNGGATPNHGTTVPSTAAAGYVTTDNSGIGGSVTGVNVAGNIGNIDATVAIKSYNDILAGQTMQQFVNSYILGDPSAGMDDTVGNVGIVAGAAGRVYGGSAFPGGLPSSNGISGSVANIYAQNIMSIVAGNVDQVAQVQSLTNYNATVSGGQYGSNKTASSHAGYTGILGNLNYITASGQFVTAPVGDSNSDATPLPGGGELIDGALVAKNIRKLKGPRDFEGTQ
jgi:hypothetical protein